MSTGVILDPVYSGKAVFGFWKDLQNDPERWKGKTVLFIHTGGLMVVLLVGKLTNILFLLGTS